MTAVVFATPGHLPLNAFTHFGVNAKPNTNNPIGYFGTGLKYAIAVLCRKGVNPVLYIGEDKYTFYTKATNFRGKEFHFVSMKLERMTWFKPRYTKLPFTTELGKNWKLWQAFRELESNTRDENGETFILEDTASLKPHPNETRFIVDNPAFVDVYHERDKIFLPGGLTVREDGTRVQVLDKPSKALYYRGLKVAETQKPSMYTYNFLSPVDLTEDRTIKYDFSVRADLARHVVTSRDLVFIERILTAKDGTWEAGLEFDYQHEEPSETFRGVIERRRGMVSRSALRYYSAWTPAMAQPRGTFDIHPRPWRADGKNIYDDEGNHVLTSHYSDQLSIDVVDVVNSSGDPEPPTEERDHTEGLEDGHDLIPF